MILARLTKAIHQQNWFTVIIEILIVMIGIFLGLQVTQWNKESVNHAEYLQALNRLEAEVTRNLAIVDEESIIINASLNKARAGMDVLISCSIESEAVEKVNAALATVRGTRSIEFRATELNELTSNPVLLAQQSDKAKDRLANLRYFLELTRSIAEQFEPNTPATWPADTPSIAVKSAEIVRGIYFGIDYQVPRYPLVLNVPLEEACKDIKLKKWIHNWEAWQSNVVIFNKKLKQEYQATLTLLQSSAL
mgnify:CR=1 FL=1